MDKSSKSTFKASKKLDDIEISLIREMNTLAGENTINLGLGQLGFTPPEAIIKRGKDAFEKRNLEYTENAGLPYLRKLISEQHQGLDPEAVVITNGAEQALYNVISAFTDPEDEVLIPEICYPAYEAIIRLNYGVPVRFKLNSKFEPDLNDIESKLTKKHKLLLINSPSNPCGVDYSNLYQRLAKLIEKKDGLYVLCDEVYSSLYLEGKKPESIKKYTDRCILVDSISKRSSSAGLRLGWSIAPTHISKEILKMQQYVSTCASSVAQYAAISTLSGECMEDELNYRKMLTENRDILLDALSGIKHIKLVKPSGGFYCFPDVSHYGDSYQVSTFILKEASVLTIPGKAFGEKGDNFIRISFAVQRKELEIAASRIREVLK